jgi:hypothetical protein
MIIKFYNDVVGRADGAGLDVSCEARSFVIRYFFSISFSAILKETLLDAEWFRLRRDLPCRIPERRCRAAMLNEPTSFSSGLPARSRNRPRM